MARKFHTQGLAMVALEQCEEQNPSARFVLSVLCLHADRTGCARPGVARIMALTGLAERTVYDALKLLKESGEIEVVERGGGRGWASEYRINPAATAPFKYENPANNASIYEKNLQKTLQITSQNPATTAPQQEEQGNNGRACAQSDSDFLRNGLTKLDKLDPSIAKNWGHLIVSATKDGKVLRIVAASRFAADQLRQNYENMIRRAFAPDANRVVFDAEVPPKAT